MKFLKFKKNKRIYLFEAEDEEELKKLIINKRSIYNIQDIELLASNAFKIKKGKNKDLHSIFSN